MIKALEPLAEPARKRGADARQVERLLALSSAAYRLAGCVLGGEAGAEATVLAAYRCVLGQARRGLTECDERVWLLREVIRAARRRLTVRPAVVNRLAQRKLVSAGRRVPLS